MKKNIYDGSDDLWIEDFGPALRQSTTAVRPVYFSDYEYRVSHGCDPHGTGRWGFCPASKFRQSNYLEHVVWFDGTITEAKRQATTHFQLRGIVDVVVCP